MEISAFGGKEGDVRNREKATLSIETKRKERIPMEENKYVAKLPWTPDHPELPTNEYIARRRTQNVIESCHGNPDLPSLNDCLSSAPPILNKLTTILTRFRLGKYGITTDIEKAFLQVRLDNDGRDATRFFWLSDSTDPTSELIMYRFKVVLFGVTCSPFILNATLLKHLSMNQSKVATILQEDLYVDNVLSSMNSEEATIKYFNESRELLKQGGFNLRSWMSNSDKLRDLALSEKVLDSDKETKILGMRWDAESDTLSFAETKQLKMDTQLTKRELLRQSSAIYDPLGLLGPITIRAKTLIQELWKKGYAWDETLPKEIENEWTDVKHDILQITTKLKIQRYYFANEDEKTSGSTLHIFVDNCQKERPYRLQSSQGDRNLRTSLTKEDISLAMDLWIKDTQQDRFVKELEHISLNPKVKSLPLVQQLRLYLDENGIIRCKGRIQNSSLEENAKFPILLPKNHKLTDFVIMNAHLRNLHTGVGQTITHIWQSYWIPAIRQCVNSVLRKCIQCQKIIGKPYNSPEPPPLPKDRVKDTIPFCTTGIDFAGPLHINTTAKVHFAKRWSNEYLTGLREYHRASGKHTGQVNIGDVVQLGGESPRLLWRLGTIEDFIKGGDGLIRAAKVRTSRGLVTTRPIVKLYPLEL
ncbi:uncharacterized protein LOC143066242 [Mytilus galloprovincialis]|uniref:uncharacterized protein LOC143066242 n=1 Tax=Mytilus galloprovincialis TaxID=29158 RepID=UPI003F7CBF30